MRFPRLSEYSVSDIVADSKYPLDLRSYRLPPKTG